MSAPHLDKDDSTPRSDRIRHGVTQGVLIEHAGSWIKQTVLYCCRERRLEMLAGLDDHHAQYTDPDRPCHEILEIDTEMTRNHHPDPQAQSTAVNHEPHAQICEAHNQGPRHLERHYSHYDAQREHAQSQAAPLPHWYFQRPIEEPFTMLPRESSVQQHSSESLQDVAKESDIPEKQI